MKFKSDILFCLILCVTLVTCSEETKDANSDSANTTFKPNSGDSSIEETVKIEDTFTNRSLTGGNELWDGLLKDCSKETTFSCIQKNVYSYLRSNLEYPNDYVIGDSLIFKKNQVDYTKYSKEVNEIPEDDGDIEDYEQGRGTTSAFEEVTDSLYDKGVKFMMTHDMEMKLPELVFEGATLKVSPRTIEDNGAVVKLEMVPKGSEVADPRFFKKMKKFFNSKLVMAFMALMLVIKLIKVKLMFVLPVLVGVGTAKKILLKVLLFLFPALSHLFKLCSYYQAGHGGTKYHKHHHSIAHVHHELPTHHHHPPPHSPPHHHHGYAGTGYLAGASYHHSPEIPPHLLQQSSLYEDDGYPYPASTYGDLGFGLINRNAIESNPSDIVDIKVTKIPAGIGVRKVPIRTPLRKIASARITPPKTLLTPPVPSGNHIGEIALKAEKEAQIRSKLQQEQIRIQQENARLQEQLRVQEQVKLQHELKLHQEYQKQQTQAQSPNQIAVGSVSGQIAVGPQVTAITRPVIATYDPFYSPILKKIDAIFAKLAVHDEGCRERLVCSMYKNPARFSPNSNLISVELSRDSKDLQKPTSSNTAVVRFYRYVQSARDGQEKRDCLKLYPHCAVNTEA